MSLVWRCFSLETPKSKAASCDVSVPRGGVRLLADTTRQQTLAEAFQKRDKLPAGNLKAKVITGKLLNFIILDDQPLEH